jgi:glycosyltransferase involved in cell wall biosynthesis
VKALCAADRRVRLIVNARNFGHVRSPYHAILQARGDAVVCMAADFQDPPEMLASFVAKWREGYKVVVAVKQTSRESRVMWALRSAYYRMSRRIADVELIENYTGFGLYDREFVEIARSLDDPYPYFRGLIAELGLSLARVPYTQPRRARGITKNNFYTLYDVAMLGITSHSKVPIRLATMVGFTLSALSLLVSIGYFVLKLLFWDRFELGTAPLLIGFFFFASVQMFFIGLIGEYVAAIHTRVMKRPLVVEKERVNFDES